MLLTCDEISAQEAFDWGFVARVVPHDQLESEADRVVQKILDTQPAARGWNKRLVNRTMMAFDAHALKETIASGETMAGTQSFSTPSGLRQQ